MNQNNINQNNGKNDSNREAAKMITLTAFLIGYVLIENLNSNEQNAVGNFFMLIGQTLCTSGSENFQRDWAPYANPNNTPPNNNGGTPSNNNGTPSNNNFSPNNLASSNNQVSSNSSNMTREQTINMLNKTRNIFNQEIDKLK